jgi:hypothetical protein
MTWRQVLTSPTVRKPLRELVMFIVSEVLWFGFLVLVAWGAIEGGSLGQGVAIFVALRYLQTIAHVVRRLDPALKEPDARTIAK